MGDTLKAQHEVAQGELRAMFPDIHRLTMRSYADWTDQDHYLAHAALCYIAAWLAAAPSPRAAGEGAASEEPAS